MSEPKGFFTYFHHAPILDALSDEQAGQLYKALMHYGSDGEVTDFSDDQALAITFSVFRNEINRNFERYQEICEKRSEAGKKGGRPKKTDTEPNPNNDSEADRANDPFIQAFDNLRKEHESKGESTRL